MKQAGLIALCFIAGLVGAMIANDLAKPMTTNNILSNDYFGNVPVVNTSPADSSLSASKTNNPVISAVKRVGPAVVNIDTLVMKRQSVFGFGDPFDNFFGEDPFLRLVPDKGQGSGIIIDSVKGYVLTNDHVVHDCVGQKAEIKVSLPNKQVYQATIIGSDPQYDIAVLKIEGKNLPTAKLSSSDDLIIGEPAIAIGNPFGYRNTVTVGVVSAVDRSIPSDYGGNLEGMIQTDAAINPGNSGGPLCDVDGNVIGMNTMIIKGAEGLGFAIGASVIKPVVDEIIKFGRVKHGWCGMQFADLSERWANQLGLSSTNGALVYQVFNGGPAEQAGIKPGDVVLEADGEKINHASDMQDILRKARVGEQLPLKLSRKGKNVNIKIQLVDIPEQLQVR